MRLSPLVIFHIFSATVGLLSGTVTMFFRKGSRGHALAGMVFVVSMMGMAASGAVAGYLKSQTTNALMGVFVLYLVATGWSAGRQREGNIRAFDWGAVVAGLAVTIGFMTNGFQAVYSPVGAKEGYPPGLLFFWGCVALLAIAGDARMLLRGSLMGTKRIARHLWRLGFAFLIAVLSFFLGQQKVMPPSWRGSRLLFVPPLLVLLALIYWVVRVLRMKKLKRSPFPARTLLQERSLPHEQPFAFTPNK